MDINNFFGRIHVGACSGPWSIGYISHLARANCFSTAFLKSFGGYVGQLRALLAALGVILGLCCCFWGMYFVGRREHLVCAPQPLPGQMVSILDLSDF